MIPTTNNAIQRDITDTSQKRKNAIIIESILLRFSQGAKRDIFSLLYTYCHIVFDSNHNPDILRQIHIFFGVIIFISHCHVTSRYTINSDAQLNPISINQYSQSFVLNPIDFFQNIVAKLEQKVDIIPQIIYKDLLKIKS